MQNPDGPSPEPPTSGHEQGSVLTRLAAVAIGVLIAGTVVSVLARSSAEHVTELFGGAGGKPQTVSCGWKLMVGANVAVSSGIVAGIQPMCRGNARIKHNEAPAEDELSPQALGVMSGPITSLRCPQGWSVVGIWGAVASFVDGFSLTCAPTEDVRGPIRHLELAGGHGGWGFHTRCEDDFVVGLRARTGLVVDAVGMLCAGRDD